MLLSYWPQSITQNRYPTNGDHFLRLFSHGRSDGKLESYIEGKALDRMDVANDTSDFPTERIQNIRR